MHGVVASPAPAPRAQTLLRFFTCGSVDDGKSTLIGRILYDTGAVFEDQLEALDKDSKKFGTTGGNLDFALLLDGLSAEREQGITIDVAYRYFASAKRAFIVADTPGHEQYTRNMATGASTADLAIILIDARKGILPQTRRHSFIVSMLGVRNIVLAVNKMDLVDFSEARFNEIVAEYRAATATLGFTQIVAFPLSAREGDNITTVSARTPWYQGPSLLTHLETVEPDTSAAAQDTFTLPVQWVNRPNLDFRGFAGTISSGTARVGTEIIALPGARRSRIASILTADGERDTAQTGEAVTITLADEIDVSRGDVIASVPHRLQPRHSLTARLLWMVDEPLAAGRDYVLRLSTATANARVTTLHNVVDVETYGTSPADALAMNQIGLVTLALDKAVVVTNYREDRELGAFILVDRITNMTVALGTVDLAALPETPVAVAHVPEPSALSSWLGAPGTPRRQSVTRDLLAGAVSAIVLGVIAWIASGSLPLGILVAVLDLVIRPLLREALDRAHQRSVTASDEVNDGGAGI
jgi:sulfate adenylyltransferase large subunit